MLGLPKPILCDGQPLSIALEMPPWGSSFPAKKLRLPSRPNDIGAWYRRNMEKHPFVLFGLPFISLMVAGSFVLTPATALRYEKHDKKVRQLTKEEELGLKRNRRRVDLQEEYFRLAGKDLDNWEQKRVPRLKGEPDGKF